MSTTTALGIVPNRRPVDLAEFRNAYGWSPSIWSRLLRHHGQSDSWVLDNTGLHRLWVDIETLPEWQQVPLVLTFDTGVIPYQAYAEAAEHLDEFERRLPTPEGHANHVPAMADLLRSGPEVPLFGVYGTSVSENPFDPMEYHEDDECTEDGYCEGHGSGIGVPEMYVLERHRHFLPPIPEEEP